MKCEKCGDEFLDIKVQTSHDIPRYMGGEDKMGRHNLCLKCHDIYERLCFAMVFSWLPVEMQGILRQKLFEWKKIYFADDRGEYEGIED
jgi:hypothetical protein